MGRSGDRASPVGRCFSWRSDSGDRQRRHLPVAPSTRFVAVVASDGRACATCGLFRIVQVKSPTSGIHCLGDKGIEHIPEWQSKAFSDRLACNEAVMNVYARP